MKPKQNDKHAVSAAQAQWNAHFIACGAIVFQVARVMTGLGIFSFLKSESHTLEEVAAHAGISEYGAKVLLEASVTAGTVIRRDSGYLLSKTGWFLINDPMVKVNMAFNQDINYRGFFWLEEAIKEGRPAGLKELGDWPTIYQGLSSLGEPARTSWFDFDHFYSDSSFETALGIVFAGRPRRLLDVGGNTGIWALRCVAYDPDVEVTVMDLPQQLALMSENIKSAPGADRIHGIPADLLEESTAFPEGYDIVWMSQFLDCFSSEQVVSILRRTAASLPDNGKLFIMETLWDRQKYATASFDLTQISLYFTVMANGNSKMFSLEDLSSYIAEAGLEILTVHDGIGFGHSIIECMPSAK